MLRIREQGLDDVEKVEEAYIETDGRISVVQRGQRQHPMRGEKEK